MTLRNEEEIRDMLQHTERSIKYLTGKGDLQRLMIDEAWRSALKWVLMEDPMNSVEVLREQ